MRLRPHHLLCTQGYEGKGYSEIFVEHMNEITDRLRKEDGLRIDLVLSTDDICSHCPHMLGVDLCEKNNEVKAHDQKVFKTYGLEEKEYVYADLIAHIRKKTTPAILNYLCGGCMWLPLTSCRALLLGNLK